MRTRSALTLPDFWKVPSHVITKFCSQIYGSKPEGAYHWKGVLHVTLKGKSIRVRMPLVFELKRIEFECAYWNGNALCPVYGSDPDRVAMPLVFDLKRIRSTHDTVKNR